MAVSRLVNSQLRLKLENGVDPHTNRIIVKTKSFNNVKTDASAEALFVVADSLAELQQLPLIEVERIDNSKITAE